jgi:hypothetical protein
MGKEKGMDVYREGDEYVKRREVMGKEREQK